MTLINDKTFAIRSIMSRNVDCEFGSVLVTIDKEKVIQEVKELFPDLIFVDEIDDTFNEVAAISVSGTLNYPYDPDYRFILKQFYSDENKSYSLIIE